MIRKLRLTLGLAGAAAAVSSFAVLPQATALMAPGTPGKDIHIGTDTDNAANPFIQPPGVTAKQHMDNTDVLVGRGNDDLLVGNFGSDTLMGNQGDDILVGGPENFTTPNSDVALGEGGDDINIWAPGDGSDAFIGYRGYDTMVFAPLVKNTNGSLVQEKFHGRRVPRVKIDGAAQFTCTIVAVPESEQLGFDHLIRFNVNGVPAVTVRQEAVEKVYCPGPALGEVLVADLTEQSPTFRTVQLNRVRGVLGAILAPNS